MRLWNSFALGLGLVCLLLPAPAQAANGPMPSVVGNKGPVSLPIYGDAQNQYRMPSSIGWARRGRLDLDLFMFFSRTTLRNAQNDFEGTSSTPGGSIGALFTFDRPDADDEKAWDSYDESGKWTFGVGAFISLAGGGTDTKVRSTEFPEELANGTGITFIGTAFTIAYTPTEWLSIAIQPRIIYSAFDIVALSGGGDSSLDGSPQISGVPLPGNPTYADFLELFSSGGDTDPTTILETDIIGFQYTANFSFSIRPTPWFGFGFSYTPRAAGGVYEGKAKVNATRTFDSALGGLAGPLSGIFLSTLPNGGANGFESDYDIEIKGIYVPRQIRGSVAFWILPNWVVAADVAWIEWSRAFDSASVSLTNGSNTDLNFVVGSNSILTSLKLRYSNVFIYSGYTAYSPIDPLTVRLGFAYGETPINKDEQGNGSSAGFVNAVVTAGMGYRVLENVELNFLAEYGLPNELRGDGSKQELTGKFSEYSSEQLFLHFGISWEF